MVKLYVPFLFFLHKVRYQTHPAPRIEIQSKLSCTSLEKKRMEWRNWRLRSNESPSGAFKPQSGLALARWSGLATTNLGSCAIWGHTAQVVFTDALAEASAFLVQRSQPHRLDLSNFVARTEYHSWLVLSTPICKFSKSFLP